MKVTSIEIANFKAIGERIVIPIRPITLIFGANSAGKSSIMQCLAMLEQSVEDGGLNMPNLHGKGPLVDVGEFRDFIYGHDLSRSFECKFNFDMNVDDLFYEDALVGYPERLECYNYYLNSSAKKFKETLAGFNKAAISFSFFREPDQDHKISIFLGDDTNPIYSYSHEEHRMQNTTHEYWKAYWDMFGTDIYNSTCIDRLKYILREGAIYKGNPGGQGYTRHPVGEQQIDLIKKHISNGYDLDATIDLYRALYPDDAFYDQLKEKARNRKTDFEVLFHWYDDDYIESGNYLTAFSGFLPIKFGNRRPKELFLTQDRHDLFSHSLDDWDDGDFFHPGQLVVLFSVHVKEFLSSFSYLGPMRERPRRIYTNEGLSFGDGGSDIKRLALDDELPGLVNAELARLQTGYQIKVVRLIDPDGDFSEVFHLKFINQKTGVVASIKDVGFGFSQILPVIVRCLDSRYRTVFIEQPELHIHPALQAELGDLLIRGALGTTKKKHKYPVDYLAKHGIDPYYFEERNNRLFIETHSEHLILRLLRRIREHGEGELPADLPPLSPDDLTVLYVQPGENGAQVTHIPVTADGEFAVPWPGGFFVERAKELF